MSSQLYVPTSAPDIIFNQADIPPTPVADATNGGRWYSLNLQSAFNAGFNANDYNNGACNGGWKAAEFMQSPYITKSSNWIRANNTGASVWKNACIYQNT